jgi:NitT/TauT family transport system substrate-binding protein
LSTALVEILSPEDIVHRRTRSLMATTAVALVLALALAACGSSSKPGASPGTTTATGGSTGGSSSGSTTLRLGYFPNVTHAPAIIGAQSGSFAAKLGSNVTLELKTFNSGTEATTALLAGSIDASFVGPNPAINAYQKTNGGIRVVAGTASGGADLVVKPSITGAADLKGKKIATPQLGNTQDVALRYWLNQNGLHETKDGGDVTIVPEDNSTTLTAFKSGAIDGAWVPEPYASRLVAEGGGKILVNEASLWPNGQFVTTLLMVKKSFLDAHSDVIKNLIGGLSDAIDLIKSDPTKAQTEVNDGLKALSGKALKPGILASAFKNVTFTLDPIKSSLQTDADRGKSLGFLKSSDLGQIFDLSLLNQVLQAAGKPAISS